VIESLLKNPQDDRVYAPVASKNDVAVKRFLYKNDVQSGADSVCRQVKHVLLGLDVFNRQVIITEVCDYD